MHNEEKELKIIVFYTCYFVDGGYILVLVKQWRYFINAERQSLIYDGKCCG